MHGYVFMAVGRDIIAIHSQVCSQSNVYTIFLFLLLFQTLERVQADSVIEDRIHALLVVPHANQVTLLFFLLLFVVLFVSMWKVVMFF